MENEFEVIVDSDDFTLIEEDDDHVDNVPIIDIDLQTLLDYLSFDPNEDNN